MQTSLRVRSSRGGQEGHVPDKSPQKPAGKKAGKSLKEKREAKRLKKDGPKPGLGTH